MAVATTLLSLIVAAFAVLWTFRILLVKCWNVTLALAAINFCSCARARWLAVECASSTRMDERLKCAAMG